MKYTISGSRERVCHICDFPAGNTCFLFALCVKLKRTFDLNGWAMKNTEISDTALKIMNAAEALFVEYGFVGTSTRMITERARVNLAAINYHFGNKDALFRAVYDRRINRFCELAIQSLDQIQAEQVPNRVEGVVQAFLQAGLKMCAEPESGGLIFVRLLAQTLASSQAQIKQIRRPEYQLLATRYTEALAQALPGLEEADILWRLHFLASTTFNAFAGNDVMRFFTNQTVVNARDPKKVAHYLQPFLVAGLKAPAVTTI